MESGSEEASQDWSQASGLRAHKVLGFTLRTQDSGQVGGLVSFVDGRSVSTEQGRFGDFGAQGGLVISITVE